MALSTSIINKLSQVSLFQYLGPAELEEIALMCTRKQFLPDSKVTFMEGEENSFCIVYEGKAIVKTKDSSGQGKILGTLHSGEFFGEVGAIDSEPKPFDVFASDEKLEILLFSQKDFLEVLQNYPSIHLALSREFCRRLTIINHTLSNIPLSPSVRIAMVLHSIASTEGTLTNEGILLPKLTQSELAKLSDSSKETISSSFIELRNLGLITPTDTRHILIPSKKKLEDWIQEKTK